MKRQVGSAWRRRLVAARGMSPPSTQLIPLLLERGIQLSRPQVYRVVHQRPERISLQMLAALCDILGCGVEDLVTVSRQRRPSTQSVLGPAGPGQTQRRRTQQGGATSASQGAQR